MSELSRIVEACVPVCRQVACRAVRADGRFCARKSRPRWQARRRRGPGAACSCARWTAAGPGDRSRGREVTRRRLSPSAARTADAGPGRGDVDSSPTLRQFEARDGRIRGVAKRVAVATCSSAAHRGVRAPRSAAVLYRTTPRFLSSSACASWRTAVRGSGIRRPDERPTSRTPDQRRATAPRPAGDLSAPPGVGGAWTRHACSASYSPAHVLLQLLAPAPGLSVAVPTWSSPARACGRSRRQKLPQRVARRVTGGERPRPSLLGRTIQIPSIAEGTAALQKAA